MSSPDEIIIDIAGWVEGASGNPTLLLERQVTEIFLTALALSPPFSEKLYLKGGLLMGVVYKSPRLTADLDLTAALEPDPNIDETMQRALDLAFPRAAALLGYPDIQCRVQTIKRRPRPDFFEEASFPALKLSIGYARRDSRQAEHLKDRRSPNTLQADISFNEPVHAVQVIRLGTNGSTIRAYSLTDLIAEKLRALLQQEGRNRYRRQDIYDLALLIETSEFDNEAKADILSAFLATCRSRGIEPDATSISDPEVVRRARSEWDTLSLEIEEVPDFESRFEIVDRFYRTLPWSAEQPL